MRYRSRFDRHQRLMVRMKKMLDAMTSRRAKIVGGEIVLTDDPPVVKMSAARRLKSDVERELARSK